MCLCRVTDCDISNASIMRGIHSTLPTTDSINTFSMVMRYTSMFGAHICVRSARVRSMCEEVSTVQAEAVAI